MKKGFTLIELLAVIVILAIISLIAIPQIAKVVENAKMNAGARSVEGHVESINTEIAKLLLKGKDINNGEISNISSLGISTKGNVSCTTYNIKGNTIISASNCSANGYTYSYSMDKGAYILTGSKGSKTNIYASANGRLHVEGSKLKNSKGEDFRLMGASMGNNSLYADNRTQFSKKSFSTLKSWGGNVIRIWIDGNEPNYSVKAWYVGHEEEYLSYLYEAVDNALSNDLYVIIVWNPLAQDNRFLPEKAKEVFRAITTKYPNNPYIMYEIMNETQKSVTWSEIKEYANEIIPVIREKSPDSIAIVATPNNDKIITAPINDRINYKNVMYTHHMYMGSFTDENIKYLKEALEANLPIIVTECAGTDTALISGADYLNDAHAYAYFRLLNKYNISYLTFAFATGKWVFALVPPNMWDESLPDSILKQGGLFAKKMYKGDMKTDKFLMKENSAASGNTYRSSEWKDKIVTVTFKNVLKIPSNAVVSWDLSATQDQTVYGYLVESSTNGMYDLVICANGYINFPINSGMLFEGMTNVEKFDFKYARTDLVNNLSYTFKNLKKIKSLDLSMFDVSKVKWFYSTFKFDDKLESINLNGWNAKPEILNETFSDCKSLKELDLSGFNVNNVREFEKLFYADESLIDLNISGWKSYSAKKLIKTFYGLKNVKELDLSSFKYVMDDYDATSIFDNINPNVTIKMYNGNFKNDMKKEYPSLNIQ